MRNIRCLNELSETEGVRCLKSITISPDEYRGYTISVIYYRSEYSEDIDVIDCSAETIADCKTIAMKLIDQHLERYPGFKRLSLKWREVIESLGHDEISVSVYHSGLPWKIP